jgi:predicted PurR-regulated permease PerM
MPPTQVNTWRTSDLLRASALVLALWIVLRFVWMARSVFLITILAILLGVTLARGVDHLEKLRIKRPIGVMLILLLFFAALTGFGFAVAPSIERQSRELMDRFPDALERLEDRIRREPLAQAALEASQPDGGESQDAQPAGAPPGGGAAADAGRSGGERGAPTLSEAAKGHLRSFGMMLFPFVSNVVTAIAGLVVILFLASYFAVNPDLYRRGLLALVPPEKRGRADGLLTEIAALLRQWLVARLIAMVVIGVITATGLAIIGVPAWGALGMIAGLLEFIPFVGPIVAAIPAIGMSLVVSPTAALWTLLLFIVIQQLEGNLLTPLLMKNRIDVPPAITIIAVAALGLVFGVVGMLLAEPLSGVAILVVRSLYVERMEDRTG